MSIEEIKKKFIIDDDALKTRLGPIATKALQHCVLDAKGNVHFNDPKLTPRQKLRLTLAARAIGAQMDAKIKSEVSVQELSANTGLPNEQVSARGAELVKLTCVSGTLTPSYSTDNRIYDCRRRPQDHVGPRATAHPRFPTE